MVAEERGDAEELFTPTVATPLTGEAVLMACMLQKMVEIKMTKKKKEEKQQCQACSVQVPKNLGTGGFLPT